MTSNVRSLPACVAAGLALVAGGCGPTIVLEADVVAEQRDGVWVFSYAETPDFSMEALGGGRAAVVDGCLWMGDAVVVWRESHLALVDDVLARVQSGEALDLQVGGGEVGLGEGGTRDDLPPAVIEHCPAEAVWLAGDSDLTITTAVATP